MTESNPSSELLAEYRDEGRLQVERLEAVLLRIEDGATPGEDSGEELMRALHTLKGNSAMLGLDAIRDAAHAVEEVFRDPSSPWSRDRLDLLFAITGALREAVDAAGTPSYDEGAARLVQLREELSGEAVGAPLRGDVVRPPAAGGEGRDEESTDRESEEGAAPPEGAAPAEVLEADPDEVVRVPFSRLNTLLNLVAELVAESSAFEQLLRSRRGELRRHGLLRELEDSSQAIESLADALHEAATELRTIPVSRVFSRFPGLVREMARASGKQVRLEVEGGDTELDKSTVDVLAEPLLHLVRNAVDHGVQLPEDRRLAGQPPEATLVLRARREGDRVLVEIEDDGPGLDREAIAGSARRLGLLAEDAEPDDEELADLIFRSGFSTRATADQTSGRGVGLDVVRRTVARLRGALEVTERPGGGTRFTLSLPLTLAVLPTLLFESEGETFALPAGDVEGTAAGLPREWLGPAEVVRHDEELVPLARPLHLLGLGPAGKDAAEAAAPPFVVFLRRGARQIALAADRLVDQDQLLVRALPSALGQPPGVSGITATHSGRPVLLLDAGGLIDLNLAVHRSAPTP
jgi:two-component system, chemotaxis family, sensor kinase CheA